MENAFLSVIDGHRDIVLYLGYLLVGVAVFLVTFASVKEQESREAEEQLDEAKSSKSTNPLVNLTRPVFRYYFVPVVKGRKFWHERRTKYRQKMITSGLKTQMTADEFIAFKMSLILIFPIMFGVMKVLQVVELTWPTVFLTGIAGWFYPDYWVYLRIKDRQHQIRRAMPFTVDLLAVSVDAGLDFLGAIGRVVEKAAANPLVEELDQVLREIKVGTSRSDALRDMAKRIDMTEINSFIAILISSEKMGSPIGKVLRQQADTIRTDRFVRAEKMGALAAQKLMLPIVFLVVPAVMLMIFGPFVLEVIYGSGGLF